MSEVKELIVSAIKPEMVPLMWPLVSDMLNGAIDHANGELDEKDVFSRIIKGSMLLVTISQGSDIIAALGLEQRDFGTGKRILNVTLAGGSNAKDWIEQMDDVVHELAKDYKCDEVYIIGRKGWTRVLRDLGYETIHTVVSKKVGG